MMQQDTGHRSFPIKRSFRFLHSSSFISYEQIEEFFHLLLRDRGTLFLF